MSENMICPACNKFQPAAEECAESGVMLAKAQRPISATKSVDETPAGADASSPFPKTGCTRLAPTGLMGPVMI